MNPAVSHIMGSLHVLADALACNNTAEARAALEELLSDANVTAPQLKQHEAYRHFRSAIAEAQQGLNQARAAA